MTIEMIKLDTILLCGRAKIDDELLLYMREKTGQKEVDNKALFEIAGKKILHYICDVLNEAENIGNIFIAGLSKEDIEFDYPVTYLELSKESSVVDKVFTWVNEYLLKRDKPETPVLIVNGDIPTISKESINWIAEKVSESTATFQYTVVGQEDMDRVFPNSRRSFTKFKDGAICGGDVVGIAPVDILKHADTWQKLVGRRKSFIRQVIFVAPFKVFKIMLGRATLDDAVHIAEKALKMRFNLMKVPYPEIAMDIDKPHQFDIVEKHLSQKRRT